MTVPLHPRVDEPASIDNIEESYGVYLERVRLMVQRYLLLQDTSGPPTGTAMLESPLGGDDVSWRALTRAHMSDARLSRLDDLRSRLSVTYEELATRGTRGEARFEQVRFGCGLSDVACDLLWVMLAGTLMPDMLGLYRAIWGQPERTLYERSFLRHVVDPMAVKAGTLIAAFEPHGPVVGQRLIVELSRGEAEEAEGLWAVSRRLLRHLTGVDATLPLVPGLVALHRPTAPEPDAPAMPPDLVRRLRSGFASSRRFLLLCRSRVGALHLARRVTSDQGVPLIEADAAELLTAPRGGGLPSLRALIGEARLRDAAIFLSGAQDLEGAPISRTTRRGIYELLNAAGCLTLMWASPEISTPLRLELSEALGVVEIRVHSPSPSTRETLWRSSLGQELEGSFESRLLYVARAFPFTAGEIDNAARMAHLEARQRDIRRPTLHPSDVDAACQALARSRMGDLAERVEMSAAWEDVVLEDMTESVIEEIIRFGRFQEHVFETLGYGRKMSYGKGLTALFWGPPGTGKTLVSGLIARELGLELYRIELSRVVSKYIGETQQHLEAIFDEARAHGIALLFDEADSLFARRTEVKTSVDRYANLGVNFLLQKIENHEGVVILTTNYPKSIDEAFMRRIRFKAEFPAPDAASRTALWQTLIPETAPLSDDVDYDLLGEVFEMTGGEIRNAILRAAFYAAEDDAPLSLDHIRRAVEYEYREAGKLFGAVERLEI